MHYVTAKGILSSKNGMNIYRGCSHGCIYCDSRSACYNFSHDFCDIEVKENALELLEDALLRKRKKCMIGTGSMSDPYLPLEAELGYTRRSLELISKYGFGAALLTKSDLILRDIDLLREINSNTKCVVQMTMTTFDEELCRKLEPNVCTTKRRFEVLCRMRDEGIPTVVWLTPVLPFINDTEENLNGILDYCEEAGVYAILNLGFGLTLRDGNREYFYKQLDRHFPGLKEKYIRTYGGSYEVNSLSNRELSKIFVTRCKNAGIVCDADEIFGYLAEFEEKSDTVQLSLFD